MHRNSNCVRHTILSQQTSRYWDNIAPITFQIYDVNGLKTCIYTIFNRPKVICTTGQCSELYWPLHVFMRGPNQNSFSASRKYRHWRKYGILWVGQPNCVRDTVSGPTQLCTRYCEWANPIVSTRCRNIRTYRIWILAFHWFGPKYMWSLLWQINFICIKKFLSKNSTPAGIEPGTRAMDAGSLLKYFLSLFRVHIT